MTSLVAVQAQDYSGAKWAIGLRAARMTDAVVEQACDAGAILRTHVLRPTWHFVTPADIRWMLAFTGPRVQAFNRSYHRKLEIDDAMLAKSRRTIERTLGREPDQTRTELAAALRRAGIDVSGIRLAFVMMHAELEGAICSGPRRGKQFTYALMDVRAAQARVLDRDEALAELTRRYFSSHGPATIRDYAWWSGLSIGEARTGVAMVRSVLEEATVDGVTYQFVGSRDYKRGRTDDHSPHAAHLLPNYDEYLIAYQDRDLAVPRPDAAAAGQATARPELPHHLIVEGRVAGSWRRRMTGRSVALEIALHRSLDQAGSQALGHQADRLSRFLGAPVETIYVR